MSSRAKYCGFPAALLAAWEIVTIAGCGPAALDADLQSASQPARPVSLQVADVEGYQQALARHLGKVVLVDFWATWCAPCLEQFPHTVELHHEFAGRGLAVLTVSLNEPDEEPQVRDFLARHGARFENLLSKYGSGVESIKQFDLPGPIPCYRLYDRSGKLHREFAVDPRATRQFTLEDIEAAIVQLL